MRINFLSEQIERFKMPWKNSAFRAYFIWITVIFGGLGIVITFCEVITNNSPDYGLVAESIATTFVAVIAASVVDLNLSFNIRNIPSLIIHSMGILGISILLLFLSFKLKTPYSIFSSILGYLLSLIIWVLANADNEKLSDESYYNRMYNGVSEHSNNWE